MKNSPFSHGSKTPFRHPLISGLPESRDVKHLYAQEKDGEVQILEEQYVRGDPVGSTATGLETLQSESSRILVWSVPLSIKPNHRCVVFAPKDFDIGRFRQDLTLLFMLNWLGDCCGRHSFLEYWQETAGILTGNVYGETQGWWHKDANVVVVAGTNKNHHLLSNALIKLVGKSGKWGGAIQINLSVELAESVFRKATSLLFDEMKRFPWVDKHK